ncbi:MAG: redox-sensing transcriptional repressor Rex [Sedimentisphaerales bacterium]|nr:redox-sensing transcriptional repressor Rex [Sedimentisphaerales bacterium]
MRYARIPDQAVQRLAMYLRAVLVLQDRGIWHVSSKDLAGQVGVNDWQVRKDFSYFGELGTPGVGYDLRKLQRDIRRILRLDKKRSAILVGVGNLGKAILAYGGFARYGLRIMAAFDNDPQKVGKVVNGIRIQDVSMLKRIASGKVSLAILAIPAASAQEVVDCLVDAGIKGILSFAPCPLKVPKKVRVVGIDIAMHLATMPYYLSSD